MDFYKILLKCIIINQVRRDAWESPKIFEAGSPAVIFKDKRIDDIPFYSCMKITLAPFIRYIKMNVSKRKYPSLQEMLLHFLKVLANNRKIRNLITEELENPNVVEALDALFRSEKPQLIKKLRLCEKIDSLINEIGWENLEIFDDGKLEREVRRTSDYVMLYKKMIHQKPVKYAGAAEFDQKYKDFWAKFTGL